MHNLQATTTHNVFAGIYEIMELCSKGHYQIACTKYFELTHGQASSAVINHPNQYVEESFKIGKEDKGTSDATPSTNKT